MSAPDRIGPGGARACLVIDRDQRDAVYHAATAQLDATGDVALLISRGDYETARRLRRQLEQSLRLLDDLGWSAEELGERFTLTMDRGELRAVLDRLARGAADAACGHLVQQDRSDQQDAERHAEDACVCRQLLGQLSGRAEPAY